MIDLGLPDADGLDVIVRIRDWSPMPIMVLSARVEEAQRVMALEQGADDFLLKPFGARELLARLRALLRRHVRGDLPNALLRLGHITVDLSRRVARNGEGLEVRLTPLEHRILETLARRHGGIVTHSTLLKEVWGPARDDTRPLRVYIGSLRRKIEAEPSRPQFILTEPNVGYRLVTDAPVEG